MAYTTVMTMMKILETKGYLKKRRHDRAFIYRPNSAQRNTATRNYYGAGLLLDSGLQMRCLSANEDALTLTK
jgi:predicted transcriptional regulator